MSKIYGSFVINNGAETVKKETTLGEKFIGIGMTPEERGSAIDLVMFGSFCIRDVENLAGAVATAVKKLAKGRPDATYLVDIFQTVINEELNEVMKESEKDMEERFKKNPEKAFREGMKSVGMGDEEMEALLELTDRFAKGLKEELRKRNADNNREN